MPLVVLTQAQPELSPFFGTQGWVNFPPPVGTDEQDYWGWLFQFMVGACRERSWAFNQPVWPPSNTIWAYGKIASLVNNNDGTYTINDPAANNGAGYDINRWFDYSPPPGSDWIPKSYDLVIDDDDPSKVVRTSISGNGAYTIKIADDFADYLTSKFLPSVASLSGKDYYVIKRGGLWWSERILQWPNELEQWIGSSTASTQGSSGTTPVNATFTDANAVWKPSQWKGGFELMVQATDGHLHRIPILDNDPTTLQLAPQTSLPFGNYSIVSAGRKWRFPKNSHPWWWYGGATASYWTHEPDDTIGATQEPETSMQFNGSDGFPFTRFDIFDNDVWTDLQDIFNVPDQNFSPNLYKTIRGIQLWLETNCVWFVEKKVYGGAAAIPTLVPATMFKAANVNWATATTGTISSSPPGINISGVALPYTPITVHYAILDDTGTPLASGGNGWGVATMSSSTFLEGSFTPGVHDGGKTIVISLGWTRYYPREFMYFYDKTGFLPDYDPGPPTIIYDPPTTLHPGLWKKRPKSTKYLFTDALGIVSDNNSWEPFIDGQFARYVGDNWNDPAIHPEERVGSASPIVSYEDKFFDGRHSQNVQGLLDADRSGTATGGSNTQLIDANKNWWPDGVMRIESGTADGGSATSLSDSSKSGNALWDSATGRWKDFVVEVTIGGLSHRRPIATFSGTTLTWTDPLPASASGQSYQIREPKFELNRFQGRTLTVTRSDGATWTIPILYSDDNTLYFAAQSFSVTADMTYRINEVDYSTVWKWQASPSPGAWVKPTGADPRGENWHVNQTENLPTIQQDFGRYKKNDYVLMPLFQELAQVFNALVWVKKQYDWTANGELNQDIVDVGATFGAPSTVAAREGWTDTNDPPQFHNGAKQLWTIDEGLNTPPFGPPPDGIPDNQSVSDGPPFAYSASDNGFHGCYSYAMGRRYAYGKTTDFRKPPKQACTVDFYVYTDPAGGTNVQSCGGVEGDGGKHTFNAQGDNVLLHTYRLFSTVGPSMSPSVMSTKLGSLAFPQDIGSSGTDNCEWTDGYRVTQWVAIARFDVPGGFQYFA